MDLLGCVVDIVDDEPDVEDSTAGALQERPLGEPPSAGWHRCN